MRRNSGGKAEARARTPPAGFSSSAKRPSNWEDAPAPRGSRSSGPRLSDKDMRTGQSTRRRSRETHRAQRPAPNAADWEVASALPPDFGHMPPGAGTDGRRRREAAAAISAAASNPGTADAALWRMSRWAENVCGPPRDALRRAVRSHGQLVRALQMVRLENGEASGGPRPAGPFQLGRMVTEAWVDARRGTFLDNLKDFDTKQFCGLMMYLEMAVTLVPDVTAQRLLSVWGGAPASPALPGSAPASARSVTPVARSKERLAPPSVASTAASAPTPSTAASTPQVKGKSRPPKSHASERPKSQEPKSQPTTPRSQEGSAPPKSTPSKPMQKPTGAKGGDMAKDASPVGGETARDASPAGEPEPDPTSPQETPKPVAAKPADSKPVTNVWSAAQSFKFCKKGAEAEFKDKVKLLAEDVATSVKGAVDYLNQRIFREPCVMVFTPVNDWYYCVYQRGYRQKSLQRLGILEPCGTFSVVIAKGYNLKNADGIMGKSDPYVATTVGAETCRTEVVENNLNPVWNADQIQFQVNIREEDKCTCTFQVLDFDKKTKESQSLGVVKLDIASLPHGPGQKIRKIDTVLDEKNGKAQGQLEYEVEFIPKRELTIESGTATFGGSPRTPRGKRKRFPKPTWTFFERELIYQEEIENFLSKLTDVSSSLSLPAVEAGSASATVSRRPGFLFKV